MVSGKIKKFFEDSGMLRLEMDSRMPGLARKDGLADAHPHTYLA